MKFSVFLKPKGFIKIPELIFGICAFSVLVSYEEVVVFNLYCNDLTTTTTTSTSTSTSTTTTTTTSPTTLATTTESEPTTSEETNKFKELAEDIKSFDKSYLDSDPDQQAMINIYYPFKFEKPVYRYSISNCNGTNEEIILEDNSSSKAVFFVFVGVMTFIYTLFMIPVYLFEDEFFSGYQYYPTSDLFIHIIFLIFWFCAAITWTAGEANLRVSTGEGNVLESNGYKFDCNENRITCTVDPPDNYTKAVVSVIFGYLNLLLFAGNIWFVYKDTNLHS